jgi:hypothetical protein
MIEYRREKMVKVNNRRNPDNISGAVNNSYLTCKDFTKGGSKGITPILHTTGRDVYNYCSKLMIP